jgi:integrase
MPLTAKEVKNAKPGRHSDGKGLYLLVKPSGAASWVLRVQYQGDRRDFGLGSLSLDPVGADIPLERRKLLTLAEAREKARLGRALAKAGINPSEHWRQSSEVEEAPPTFRHVAEECHRQATKGWRNGKHRDEWLGSLDRYAFATIGDEPVEAVDAAAIQKVLLPIWLAKGETARRVKQRIGVVLDYAHAKGLRSTEAPMRAVNQLMRSIKQPKGGNFAAMPYKDVPAFMAALREGELSVGRLALQFLILTAARSGEVRGTKDHPATWAEIDWDAAEWRIPAQRMKAGKLHIVPLVPAAMDILRQMRDLFGSARNKPIFPGAKGKPMSDATLAKVLRTAGAGEFTVHGFRSSFRDWAADNGYADAWAEAALAHSNPNKTEAAYRRTTYFEQRRDRLMPAWAAFVLADKSNVVSLAAARA